MGAQVDESRRVHTREVIRSNTPWKPAILVGALAGGWAGVAPFIGAALGAPGSPRRSTNTRTAPTDAPLALPATNCILP